ncbi:MAG: hypothetical protein DA408_09845 [Bacteroidetes bacterium]|nr:MAG: hypothetical protein C7N36_11335 [Bacteroidota bacterium]PTM12593.1 MAG: hypothetical protein DA408_09845 [Bacteroidota bacterium]
MKMKNLQMLFALVLTSSLLLTGCFIDADDHPFGCWNATGPITTATLAMPAFDGIVLAMNARVEITQGDEQVVVVEGKSDILNELDLDVHNGIWTIRTQDCVRNVDNLTFFITMPEVHSIRISGSGNVVSTNTLGGDREDLELDISGSGELDLALNVDDIDAEISGSGKIFLEGQADRLDLAISGSGDFRGFDLFANTGDIHISGSGNAEVRVADALKIRISGSGDVFYKGTPIFDISISGSGSVIDAN